MIQLGITYLKINIDEDKVILRSSDEEIQVNPKRKKIVEEPKMVEVVSKKSRGTLIVPEKSNSNRRSALSVPTLKMGRNLHRLLLNLDKLLSPPPTRNPNIFQNNELYIESLLRKLDSIQTNEEFEDFHGFLKVDYTTSLRKIQQPIIISENTQALQIPEIISEIELLKLSGNEFLDTKESAIKTLVSQIIKFFDKILEDCIEEDVRRRSKLRCYVNILILQRKIEIYCNLYKERKKGETVKHQAKKKIITYSKPERDLPPKIKESDLTSIIRAAKKIERLVGIANNNWGIVDAFPNLDVNFFKSTSINVNDYERWLKLVETDNMISEEEGKKLYQQNKMTEIKQRQQNIHNIYESANLGDLVKEVLSNTEWDVCDK